MAAGFLRGIGTFSAIGATGSRPVVRRLYAAEPTESTRGRLHDCPGCAWPWCLAAPPFACVPRPSSKREREGHVCTVVSVCSEDGTTIVFNTTGPARVILGMTKSKMPGTVAKGPVPRAPKAPFVSLDREGGGGPASGRSCGVHGLQ